MAISAVRRRTLLELCEGRCTYCGVEIIGERPWDPFSAPFSNWAVDHIIPKAGGGRDTIDNLCIACTRCNNAKGVMSPEWLFEYAEQQLEVARERIVWLERLVAYRG